MHTPRAVMDSEKWSWAHGLSHAEWAAVTTCWIPQRTKRCLIVWKVSKLASRLRLARSLESTRGTVPGWWHFGCLSLLNFYVLMSLWKQTKFMVDKSRHHLFSQYFSSFYLNDSTETFKTFNDLQLFFLRDCFKAEGLYVLQKDPSNLLPSS